MGHDDRSKRIRALMAARGIETLSELARASGLRKSTVSKILSPTKVAKYPQADTLAALARALGTTVDYLERGAESAGEPAVERAIEAHAFDVEVDVEVDVEIADRVIRDVRAEAATLGTERSVPAWRLRIEQLTRAAVGAKKVDRAATHTRARKS